LPKIAENRVIMAFSVHKKSDSVHKKGEKPLKAELKTQFGKEVKNVLELI
jgi:flagellar basal body-associated protein FliL